jgi:hypothetical protein
MDSKFGRLVIILVAMAIGYSILGTPGDRFAVDVMQLKNLLLYVLLACGAYAIYLTFRHRPPPPGV